MDQVVDTISAALQKGGLTNKAVERWYREMPREEEMLPRDKYTIFDRKEKSYRKGIHSMSAPALWNRELLLTLSRTAQMDPSQPTCQSSWFLSSPSRSMGVLHRAALMGRHSGPSMLIGI